MNCFCYQHKEECCQALAKRITVSAQVAIARHGRFSLVLTGGSTPELLYSLLAEEPWNEKIDWQKTDIFFGDERCVPPDHQHSNYRMASRSLLENVPIPIENVHRIMGENDPDDEARRYQKIVLANTAQHNKKSSFLFDYLLLGLGSDGHCASLFPGEKSLSETSLVTAAAAPKKMSPNVARVSLTLTGISRSREVSFLVDGEAKEDIVGKVFSDREEKYPASMVKAKQVSWYLSGMNCSTFMK